MQQSNMQYTPRSMAGMNNLSAELLSADGYGASMRFFTVGDQDTTGTGPGTCPGTACAKAFRQLNPVYQTAQACNTLGKACRELWEPASAAALGREPAWNTFSAVCFLTGRTIHDALGGNVPIGLISSSRSATKVEVWQPPESIEDCPGKGTGHGTLWNSMVAPFAFGPMALKGFIWCEWRTVLLLWLVIERGTLTHCAVVVVLTVTQIKENRTLVMLDFTRVLSRP